MVTTKRDSPPVFKGLSWYREQYFSLFVPIDWSRSPWPDGRMGVLFSPTAEDGETLLGVEVQDLGFEFQAEDKDELMAGFLEGIHALAGVELEEQKDWVVGNLICLEAKYSYLEGGTRRKRWTRVFYDKTRQLSFIAQGSSPEAFAYWLPMFYEAMMMSRVHQQKPSIAAEQIEV
ncbi:MAG: hypothetical protein KC422_06765 [Trueperaceae bacterium]|nr:hypothetical protein [Trueperaceae bacterium]